MLPFLAALKWDLQYWAPQWAGLHGSVSVTLCSLPCPAGTLGGSGWGEWGFAGTRDPQDQATSCEARQVGAPCPRL